MSIDYDRLLVCTNAIPTKFSSRYGTKATSGPGGLQTWSFCYPTILSKAKFSLSYRTVGCSFVAVKRRISKLLSISIDYSYGHDRNNRTNKRRHAFAKFTNQTFQELSSQLIKAFSRFLVAFRLLDSLESHQKVGPWRQNRFERWRQTSANQFNSFLCHCDSSKHECDPRKGMDFIRTPWPW